MPLPRTWSQPGEYFIPLRMHLLTRMIERELAREMQSRFSLSLAEWRVIALICSWGAATAADVSSAYEIDPGLVSRAVASLIRNGLVERSSNSTNRKFKIISETAAGRAIFEQATQMRAGYFSAVLQDLEADEKAALERALTTIATRVDALRRQAAGDEGSASPSGEDA